MSLCLVFFGLFAVSNSLDSSRPNIIFFLTDDQDLLFDSMAYLPYTDKYLKSNGLTFENAFISTPICCPSRTESITGRTFQNIRSHKIDCMNVAATYNIFNNTQSMFQMFHSNGYTTASFGKLTNNMPKFWCKQGVPPLIDGFDRIQCPCDYNNFYGNKYMNLYSNGSIKYRDQIPLTPSLYETSMVGNATIEWLQNDIIGNQNDSSPFIAWVGLHAPHFPADPASWYADRYNDSKAPRTPNFNLHVYDHHDFVSTNPEFDENAITFIDQLWRDRLRSLLSVDDVFYEIIQVLESGGILDNTYIVFSSDHGYHLGQWRLPCSKQQMYETDTRIPTYIVGPNIAGNTTSKLIVTNTDFLPTFLDLASIEYDENTYDGMSWVKGNIIDGYNNEQRIEEATIEWRDKMIIQYGGGDKIGFDHCQTWFPSVTFRGQDVNPPEINANNQAWIINGGETNTWRSVRILNETMNVVYTEFVDHYDNMTSLQNPWFHEYYDIAVDPFEIDNIYSFLDQSAKNSLHDLLMRYAKCNGTACW